MEWGILRPRKWSLFKLHLTLDEAGVHENEDYEYGYCKKGQRFYALKSGNRGKRVNMIGALNNNKIIASMVFDGYCNT